MRWRNGLGNTTELAREDAGTPAGFFWRISRADVVESGVFSSFPGVDRILLLLAGAGFTLGFAGGGKTTVSKIHEMVSFPGDVVTNCTLRGGPCRDFNIMVSRDQGRAAVALHNDNTRTNLAPISIFHALAGDWSINLTDAGYILQEDSLAVVRGGSGTPVSVIGDGLMLQIDIKPVE